MKEFPVPHTVSELICINCKKRWIAARPEIVLLKEIQCPKCKKQGYTIDTGQVINEEDCEYCEKTDRCKE